MRQTEHEELRGAEFRITAMAVAPMNAETEALSLEGRRATVENRTAEQRRATARKAVADRWAKPDKTIGRIEEGTKTLIKRKRANQNTKSGAQ